MLKKLLFISFIIVSFWQLQAQTTATIGNGSLTGSNTGADAEGAPFYRSSATSSFDFAQTVLLYTSSELASIGIFPGAVISSIGYYKSAASGSLNTGVSAQVSILMNSSSATSYPIDDSFSNLTSGFTTAFSGSVDNTIFTPAQLVTINLTNPYTYTGGTLEVGIDWDVSAATSPIVDAGFFWLYDDSSTDRARGAAESSAVTNLDIEKDRLYQTDFTFTGGTPPSCPQPGSLTVTNITSSGADLSWTENGTATIYDVEIVATGATPSGTPTDAGVSNPFTVNTLMPATTYDFYVRAACSATDVSAYTGPTSFTTGCVAVADFSENFDGVNTPDLPVCWSSIVQENIAGTDPEVTTSTSADNTAPNGARLYNGSGTAATTPNDAILITPQLTTLQAQSHRLVFFADGSPAGDVEVGTITDPTDASTFTLFQTVAITTTHTEYTINFDTYTGADTYIAFRHPNLTTVDSIYLDDIVFEPIPTCLAPSDLDVDSITQTNAVLSWLSGGSGESAWDIEIGLAGFTPTGTPTDNATSNPYNKTGLTAGTSYDYYIRANCGGGDLSVYSGPFNFITICDAVADFSENFDSVSTPDLPNCWRSIVQENITGTDPAVTTSTSADNTAPNGLRLYNGSGTAATTPNDAILITPQLTTLQGQSHRLRFFADGSPAGDVEIGTMSDPLDQSTFTLFQTVSITTTHTEYIINFDTYTGTDTFIAFRHPNLTTVDSIYLDDIIFEMIPPCQAPTNLALLSATDTMATIGWTNVNSSTVSSIIWGPAGFDPTMTGITVVGMGNTATIAGLMGETNYDFYVTQDCTAAGDGLSVQVGPLSIQTPCVAIAAPYFVDFENFSAALSGFVNDQCWNELSDTDYDWAIDTSGGTTSTDTGPSAAFSGTNFMFVESSNGNSGAVATVLSRAVDLSTLTAPSISFYYHMYGSAITSLNVSVSSDNGATFTNELTITGQQQTDNTDAWINQIIDLSPYANQTVIVAFTTNKSTGTLPFNGDVAIDDVNFDEIPTCVDVSAITIDSVTDDSITVSWTENSTPPSTAWEVVAVLSGAAAPTVGITNATTNPYTIPSLMADTAYDIYIRTDCGTTFAGPVAAATDCATITPDYFEDFSSFVPDCWEEADGGDIASGPTNFGSGAWLAEEFAHNTTSGLGAVNINLYRAVVSDWIVSPLFDLSAGGYELNLDVAVTDFNNSGADTMGSDDEVILAYTIDGTTWIALQTWDVNNQPATAGETYNDPLAGITSATVRFGIYATDGAVDDSGVDYDFHIDNFQVRTPPTCPDTSNLTLVSNTDTQATINFDSGNATSSGNYEYSLNATATATPAVSGSWTDTAGNMPNVTYTIMGLTAQTEYFVYVREICAVGDESAWSLTPINFTTDCGAVTMYPVITDFSNHLPNACWDEAGNGEIAAGPSNRGSSDWRGSRSYENAASTVIPSNAINLFSNVDREWLITETYDMTGSSNDVLTIEVAVTDWTSSGASDATDTDVMGSDDQVDLLITTDGGTTWTSLMSWTAANQPAVTGTREIIDLSTYTGNVQFAFFASDGMIDDSEDYDFHVGLFTIDTTAGIDDALTGTISMYPNPHNSGSLSINTSGISGNSIDVTIYDSMGKMVLKNSFNEIRNTTTIDNIDRLSSGIYFIQVAIGTQSTTLKLIKE